MRNAIFAAILVSVSSVISAEGVKAKQSSSASSSEGTYQSLAMPAMPSITDISSPSMPVISAPTLGSSFYTPGKTTATATAKKQETTSSISQPSAPSSTMTPTSPSSVQSASLSAASLSAAAGNNSASSVTAADLSSLDSAGVLGSFYSLMGKTDASASSGNTLISNVLEQLSALKQDNKAVLASAQAEKNADATASADATTTTTTREDTAQPAILRFTVNGYNVLATCRTVYFSSRETNGAFLLTADRKYISDGKTRNETFYLLFKQTGSSGFATQYAVEPAVVQDYANVYSFVYQLAQRHSLTASKTGNLITMRVNEPAYNLDLLIDAGNSGK